MNCDSLSQANRWVKLMVQQSERNLIPMLCNALFMHAEHFSSTAKPREFVQKEWKTNSTRSQSKEDWKVMSSLRTYSSMLWSLERRGFDCARKNPSEDQLYMICDPFYTSVGGQGGLLQFALLAQQPRNVP